MITQDRDLHTGAPVWTAYRIPRLTAQRLTKNISTDILVIGAGISGAMIAEALSSHGFDVVIVDRGKPTAGSTAASTCLIQFEIDDPLSKLVTRIGHDKAVRAWRRSRLGVEALAAKIEDLGIDCDLERRDTLYLNGDLLDTDGLKRELHLREAIGLAGVMRTHKELRDLYGIKAKAAILSHGNLSCNPVQLATGFLKAAIKNGAALYSFVDITGLDRRQRYTLCRTANGPTIKAHHVIFATGYDIPKYIHTRKHKITSTWALATKPVRGLPKNLPMIWEASDMYCYGRTLPDGRILFGGEDENFSNEEKRDALLPEKTSILERKLHALFPDHDFTVDHAWTGSFGTSTNGLPTIGPIPRLMNCHAVMAYGGNGITFSRLAADMITASLSGYKDPDADLFAFRRS